MPRADRIKCTCTAEYHDGKPCPNEVTVWLLEPVEDMPRCTPCGKGRYCK